MQAWAVSLRCSIKTPAGGVGEGFGIYVSVCSIDSTCSRNPFDGLRRVIGVANFQAAEFVGGVGKRRDMNFSSSWNAAPTAD